MSTAVLEAIDGHCRRSDALFGELSSAPLLPSAFSGGFTCPDAAAPAPYLATATIHSLASTVSALVRRVARLEATCVVLEGRALGHAHAPTGSAGGVDPGAISDAIAAAMRPLSEVMFRHDNAIQHIASHLAESQQQQRVASDGVHGTAPRSHQQRETRHVVPGTAHREGTSAASAMGHAGWSQTNMPRGQSRPDAVSGEAAAAAARLRSVIDDLDQPPAAPPDLPTGLQRHTHAPDALPPPSSSTDVDLMTGGARGRDAYVTSSSSADAAMRGWGVHHRGAGSVTTGTTGQTGSSADEQGHRRRHHSSFTTEDALRVLWDAGHVVPRPRDNVAAGSGAAVSGAEGTSGGSHEASTIQDPSGAVTDRSATAAGGGGATTSFELSAWAGGLLHSLHTLDGDTSAPPAAVTAAAVDTSSTPPRQQGGGSLPHWSRPRALTALHGDDDEHDGYAPGAYRATGGGSTLRGTGGSVLANVRDILSGDDASTATGGSHHHHPRHI